MVSNEDKVPDYLGQTFDNVPEDLPGEPVQLRVKIPVNTHLDLPSDGSPHGGLYCTHTPARLYGTAKTIEIIGKTGAAWEQRHPGVPIGIGDISKMNGGPLSGHASHRRGVDFDVRPMRKDHKPLAVTINDSEYSSDLTKELIDLFVHNGINAVTHVFFNDPQLRHPPVQPWPNHNNHFHVRLALM